MSGAADLCLEYLGAMEARDLDRAHDMIAAGFEMTFPGDIQFSDFAELMEWAAPRYLKIAKRIERVDEAPCGEMVVVYVSGTLHGERPDGTPFDGIRFIDRFETCAGRITRQEVWNDLGELSAQ